MTNAEKFNQVFGTDVISADINSDICSIVDCYGVTCSKCPFGSYDGFTWWDSEYKECDTDESKEVMNNENIR